MATISQHHDQQRQAVRSGTAGGTPDRPALTVGEALVGGLVVLAGLAAWAGLALAHLDRFSLPAVLAATAAMVVVAVAAVRVLPPVGRGAGTRGSWSGSRRRFWGGLAWRAPRLVVDRRELAVLVVLAAVAAVLNFPGFPYGLGDKDPGTYVSHGIAIARTGTWQPKDPVLEPGRAVAGFQPSSPGARLPGLWYEQVTDGHVTVQFYHLWSAALAVAYALGGLGGLVGLAPLLGLLSVLAVTLATRRAFGLAAGALAGLLLATCMLQVWQARYPSAEIMTQLLVAGSLLGVVVGVRTGWRPASAAGGLLLGLAYLARADGLLLVLLAAAAGCVLVAVGRFGARAAWLAGGLAVTLPHGLLQAYVLAGAYTAANGVPGWPVVAGLVGGGFALAVVLRVAARGLLDRLDGALRARHVQRRVGAGVVALAVAGLAVGFLRPLLFGEAHFNYNGQIIRSYDEQTLRRLSWFLTVPGIVLMAGGLALVVLRRWSAAAWALVLPLLLTFPVYGVAASNSSRLMWWSRRFVPVVLPGIVVLVAVAVAWGLLWAGRRARGGGGGSGRRGGVGQDGGSGDGRGGDERDEGRGRWVGRPVSWPVSWPVGWRPPVVWVRAAAAGCAAFLVAAFLSQSLSLRDHREFAGSFAVTRRLAAAAGDRQGVFLLDNRAEDNLAPFFGVPLWLQQGQVSVLLRAEPSVDYVHAFVRGFPGQPVFLVMVGGARPDGYDGLALRRVDHVRAGFPVWDESNERRPVAAHEVRVDLSVWKVVESGRGPDAGTAAGDR